ncbi:hypothetical protein TSTA_051470 [Talaromyces stipitatus ATCC 10500]|uniref:Uncharacterized protein n=1 Tax=Talaromyces stipitatus (strain ATCC 10500 / CBS 375.48 / QM 6759 / NRRL 1006) TaxID=441959 RepID=B8MJ49_TALSN|nr:uncharacterized protein TSTA_051470 [Talaromyces stipitatus ATCC 10500]EED15711.1 hypothetical protein TSTA_051470 [Talaromyces stipitatus ATCC 10500]
MLLTKCYAILNAIMHASFANNTLDHKLKLTDEKAGALKLNPSLTF